MIAIAHASTVMKDKRYEQYVKHGGFTVNAIDAFRLGYEFVRDGIGMRRDHSHRLAGQEDNVAIVKTVKSA